jgi:hypothetical protein
MKGEHNTVMMNDGSTMSIEQFLANRRAEGLRIDPATAKARWTWARVLDPYGIFTLGAEEECVGRMYYAISPESGMRVWFGDLPDTTEKALWERIKSGQLSFDDEARKLSEDKLPSTSMVHNG